MTATLGKYVLEVSQSNETLSFAFDAMGILDPLLCQLHGVAQHDLWYDHELAHKVGEVKSNGQRRDDNWYAEYAAGLTLL